MNNLSWYFNLYYKFRDYPIAELNATLKNSELKALYSNMLRKLFALFQLDNRKDGQIQGLISKNNYDLMLSKKTENNLAQQELPPQEELKEGRLPITDSAVAQDEDHLQLPKRDSVSSFDYDRSSQRASQCSRDSRVRWVGKANPFERNMDVFYELMIKMIRVSFRRLMIENFALDRYGMHVSKQAIREILQASSQFEGLLDYAQKETTKDENKTSQEIDIVHYPANTEQMKFEFLKYCISTKVYNNPTENRDSFPSSTSSISSNQQPQSQQHQGTDPKIDKLQDNTPQVSDNQIEGLIIKISQGETSVFNKIIELYQKQIRDSDKNKAEILGVKHIAQSILDFASKEFCNKSMPLIFGNEHNYSKHGLEGRGQRIEVDRSLSNSNIMLSTWFDLILFKQSPQTLLSIIQELVKMENNQTILGGQDEAKTSFKGKQQQNKEFYYKISSYLHLLILNSTKNIFVQSLLKVNYLLVLSKDVIGGQDGFIQSFKHIFLKEYQQKTKDKTNVYENILLTFDARSNKYLWKEQALGILISKWKIIANVITELCAKNNSVFFVAVFEKCVALLDKQLTVQVQLIEKLMLVVEGIQSEVNPSSNDNQKAKHTCRVLCGIIGEIIGFGNSFCEAGEQRSEEKYLNINNIINMKSEIDRYKESTFANREECAEQIAKWNEIISQNIYVYSQYKHNLQLISKLFKNNQLYIALWFNKFHAETKLLVRKVSKNRLENIFQKFNHQIPALWESMTTDNDKKKKIHKSRFQRNDRTKVRNRISSIKMEKNLTITEKKAIVLNYMIKAELELYSHYMLINYLNSQKNFSQLFEKDTGVRPTIKSKPQIFSHEIIKKMILFSGEQQRLKTIKLEKETYASISRRTQKHMSYKMQDSFSSFNIEGMRTMSHIKKNNASCDFQDLLNAIHHFEKPMDLELELDDHWKEKFGDQEIQYLGELNDYVRYLNEINYLYEFWSWQEGNGSQNEEKQKPQKRRVELLDGNQYQQDLQQIDRAFEEIKENQGLVHEVSVFKGQAPKIMYQEHLAEMLKRIKIHNKELYMIIEAIIQGQNYFKLVASNLIGRDKNSKFKQILEDIIQYYKSNKRQKPSIRMLDKVREVLQFENQMVRKDSSILAKGKNNDCSKGQSIVQFNLPDTLIRKGSKRGNVVSHFEFAPEYYKIQSKIFRINCLIAALEIDNHIFRNIKHSHVLSKQRLEKLTIIGSDYYDKLQNLLQADKVYDTNELAIGEESLMRVKNVYEKKLLLLMVSIINMNYTMEDKVKRFTGRGRKQLSRVQFSNVPEEDLRNYPKVLERYTDLLKKFLYWKIKENIKRVEERERFENLNIEKEKKEQKEFSVCNFIEEVLQLSEKNEECEEEVLLIRFELQIEQESNLKFSQEFKRAMEEETSSLQIYRGEFEKVEYLRKKLSYLLMREMYFTLNYENDFLTSKSINSKKNYTIYEERIFKFYEEIIKLDYEEYIEKKEEEIKKRSIHLKNYQFKYQQQPALSRLQVTVNQLICCLFNQLLTTYTTKVEQRMLNCKPKNNSEPLYQESIIYQSYCASEYLKPIPKLPQKKSAIVKKKNKRKMPHKESISSIFANIFFSKQETSDKQLEKIEEEANPLEAIRNNTQSYCNVLVYSLDKYELSQSLRVYFKIIAENDYSYSKCNSEWNRKKYGYCQINSSTQQQPITAAELELMKENEGSLISLLKAQFLENINLMKCKLIRTNLISNVEKLYINLDVRHKVFQSFKDRILNYQLQKAKIYHQYMDYIRGLKLDVYSHMAGEDPMPYIKIIHAVKLYRLQIKKKELQQRVNQQFQKNLQKWNKGIQVNLESYNQWLNQEEKEWNDRGTFFQGQIKALLDIHNIVLKQSRRQNKTIKKKTAVSNKSIIYKQIIQEPARAVLPTSQDQVLKKFNYLKPREKIGETRLSQQTGPKTINCKASASQSTKNCTKYEKITVASQSIRGYRGQSCAGIRGISIKYDVSNILPPSELQDKKRVTQAFNRSGVKTANPTIYDKTFKRYQSAQKLRPKIEYA